MSDELTPKPSPGIRWWTSDWREIKPTVDGETEDNDEAVQS